MFINIITVTVLLLIQCGNPYKKVLPKAEKGILDLRDWDFQKDGNISLDGEWEFFPNEFLNPVPLWETDRKFEAKKFIILPSKWESFQKENGLDRIYYGTFRLKIFLPNSETYLSIKIPNIGSAYSLYSNGLLISSKGKIAKTKNEFIPSNEIGMNDFIHEQESVELIVHVSNFVYENGSGLWESFYLGLTPNINQLSKTNSIIDSISFGTLFIMSIYHFSFYFLRRRDKAALYFGLVCLAVSIRSILYRETLLLEIPFFQNQYYLTIRMEIFFLYLILPTFLLYIKSLFPENFQKSFLINILLIIGIVSSLLGLLTPIQIYTQPFFIIGFQLAMLTSLCYLILKLPNLILEKRDGANVMGFGILVNLFTVTNDILYVNKLINSIYFGPFGFIVFVFAQAIFLARRFSKGFIESENLAAKLTYLNANLENKIAERTKDLEDTKQEIEDINNFIYLVNSLSDLNSIFIEISKYFYHKFGITGSWLFLPNEQKEFLYAYKAYNYEKIPEEKFEYMINRKVPLKNSEGGMLYLTYRRKKPFYLSKIPKFEFAIDKEFVETLNVKSFLCVPLIRKNECVGILAFSNLEKEMKLSKKKINFISNLCAGIAGAIDTNHLLQQVEKAKLRTEELNKLIKSLNEELDLKEIMKKFQKFIKENFGINDYALYKVNTDKTYLELLDMTIPYFVNKEVEEYICKLKIPIQKVVGAHAFVFKTKKTFYTTKIKKARVTTEELFIIEKCKIQSFIMIPLVLNGEPIGILDFSNISETLLLSQDDINRLSILAEHLTGIIYSSNLFKQVQEEKENALIAQFEAVHAKQEVEKLAESRKRLSAVGQMVAGIVHDIKNPIASIKGFAESLNSDKLKPEKRERNTKMIIQEMERLSDMVYEILDFSKGKISLELSKVQLSEYLKEILSFQQTNLDYNSILTLKDFEFIEEVELDTSRIRRVLVNLIQNSIEVMYDGKKEYYVKLSTREEGEYCIIAVEDNGPGLPASFEEKIFEAFATEGKAKGTGLGLFMSKWIVEAHGGTLTYQTKVGEGTTFFIKIPKTQKGRELENEENTHSG